MPVVIDSTVGGASANAYDTVAYITTYSEGTVWASNWAAKTADEKAALAVRATRALDTLSFEGDRADDDQALQFPRVNVTLPNGNGLDSATIPAQIKQAWAHVACWLSSIAAGTDPFSVDPTAKYVSKQVGPLATTYVPSVGTDGSRFLKTVIAPMLRPFGLLGAGGSARLVR